MKKTKKKKRALRIVRNVLLSLLMICAAVSGIYCAKVYTLLYNTVVDDFAAGTLDAVEISEEKCNILIMGTDKEGMRTDVMMLAQIDSQTGKAVVMSIPRDTRIKSGSRWMKINEAHALGFENGKKGSESSILAVKELTGIPVNHYVKVNFDAFIDCIDALGGVDFDVPQRMKYKDPYQGLDIDLQPGMQHLDGDKAEQLVRFRRYKNGDLGRIEVQQNFLHALAEQKLKLQYIGKIDDIYKIIAENMETSMVPGDLVQCGMQLLSVGTDRIETVTMPNTPEYIGEVSYVIPDYAGIAVIREENFGYTEED